MILDEKKLQKKYGIETSKTYLTDTDISYMNDRKAFIANTWMKERTNTELHQLINGNGIYYRTDFDDNHSFYIFPRNDPYKMLGTTREYFFITKPDLHIFGNREEDKDGGKSYMYNNPITKFDATPDNLNKELNNMPFFRMLADNGWLDPVLSNLQYSAKSNKYPLSPFITILSNYKTSNLDLSSISVGEDETATNIYNTRIFYRKPSDSADEDNEFNIEFKDNKFLDCYLWFKAYDLYEQQKYHGVVTPVYRDYITNKVLSDQMTAFKFIVGDDGETLVYWAELWGCFPKEVPRATFSDLPEDGQLKYTVSWKATFQQDMDPMILVHFNSLCEKIAGKPKKDENGNPCYPFIDLYNSNTGAMTGESALCPYVILDKKEIDNDKADFDTRSRYKFKWISKKQVGISEKIVKEEKYNNLITDNERYDYYD